jgi:hypothetical protein
MLTSIDLFVLLLVFVVVISVSADQTLSSTKLAVKPNVVIIIADDLGW